jgi:hypothetical protein
MQLVVDNSTGGDEQLAARVARGLRERGFSVELREPSEMGTIEDVVRSALMHSTPRRRTRAVPLAIGEGGRVLAWFDVFG